MALHVLLLSGIVATAGVSNTYTFNPLLATLRGVQVMMEHSGGTADLQGATLAFVGDCCNNVTYDLMRAGIIMGMTVKVRIDRIAAMYDASSRTTLVFPPPTAFAFFSLCFNIPLSRTRFRRILYLPRPL